MPPESNSCYGNNLISLSQYLLRHSTPLLYFHEQFNLDTNPIYKAYSTNLNGKGFVICAKMLHVIHLRVWQNTSIYNTKN